MSSSSLRAAQQQQLLSPKTSALPWDDVLEYDVDGVLALAEEFEEKKATTMMSSSFKKNVKDYDDDLYWTTTTMFPKHNPIDDLAKSVVSCDIRADPNASDAENVVLMTHLAKVLQVAFERALTRLETTTTTTTSDYDFERIDDRKDALERENEEYE